MPKGKAPQWGASCFSGISPMANIFSRADCEPAPVGQARKMRTRPRFAQRALRIRQKEKHPIGVLFLLEQMTGIEPACSAWEADALPLSYICKIALPAYYSAKEGDCQSLSGIFRKTDKKIDPGECFSASPEAESSNVLPHVPKMGRGIWYPILANQESEDTRYEAHLRTSHDDRLPAPTRRQP